MAYNFRYNPDVINGVMILMHTTKHRFNVETSLFVRFEDINYKGDKSDVKYFRVIASYEF